MGDMNSLENNLNIIILSLLYNIILDSPIHIYTFLIINGFKINCIMANNSRKAKLWTQIV